MREAEKIINSHQGDIARFVDMARQQAAFGLPYLERTATMADLSMRFIKSNGYETVQLLVRPDVQPGGAVGPIGLVFDINVPFTGWPIPLYDKLTGSGAYAGLFYYDSNNNNGNGMYLFDPMFVPLPPGAMTDTSTADLAPGKDLWNWIGSNYQSGIDLVDFSNFPLLLTLDPSNNSGYVPDWQVGNVGGSGFCTSPIVGKQYWEVEIIKLPTATPGPVTVSKGQPFDGTGFQTPVFYDAPDAFKNTWPADLNTFYSPTIGLVPQNFIDAHWKGNVVKYQGEINLDPDPFPAARSIGLTRTKVIPGNIENITFTAGGYFLRPGAVWNPSTLVYDPVTYDVPVPVGTCNFDTNPYTPLTSNINVLVRTWIGAEGQYLTEPLDHDASMPPNGPTAAQAASAYPVGTFTFAGQNWDAPYKVGDFYSDPLRQGTLIYVPQHFDTNPSASTFGDLMFDADFNVIPQLQAVGEHTSAYLGRLDAINKVWPAQTCDINAQSHFGNLANGVWSGIDMGALKEKDTIMVAVDDHTREVWFGKNGKWWGLSGESDKVPGQEGFPGALLMDGTTTTKYYPACSFRLGPTHLQMKFGRLQKYQPPGGFTSYPVYVNYVKTAR